MRSMESKLHIFDEGLWEQSRMTGTAIIMFFVGVIVGMFIYWAHTIVYRGGFIDGYGAGLKDGKKW